MLAKYDDQPVVLNILSYNFGDIYTFPSFYFVIQINVNSLSIIKNFRITCKCNIKWNGNDETTTQFDPKKWDPNRRVTIKTKASGPAPKPKDTNEPMPQTRDNEEPPDRPLHPLSPSRTGA